MLSFWHAVHDLDQDADQSGRPSLCAQRARASRIGLKPLSSVDERRSQGLIYGRNPRERALPFE